MRLALWLLWGDIILLCMLLKALITRVAPMSGMPKPSEASVVERARMVLRSADAALCVNPIDANAPRVSVHLIELMSSGDGVSALTLYSTAPMIPVTDFLYSLKPVVITLAVVAVL